MYSSYFIPLETPSSLVLLLSSLRGIDSDMALDSLGGENGRDPDPPERGNLRNRGWRPVVQVS